MARDAQMRTQAHMQAFRMSKDGRKRNFNTEHITLYCTWQPSALTTRPRGQVSLLCVIPSDLSCRKTKSPWATVQHCLCDPTFSHFGKTLTYDRQTDK